MRSTQRTATGPRTSPQAPLESASTPPDVPGTAPTSRGAPAHGSVDPWVAGWLLTLTVLVLGMVGLGGYTRLERAGLSIVEWAPVSGILPPLDEAAWRAAHAAYAASPEGRFVNAGMDLAAFKRIFLIEWFHRLYGRSLGLAFALPWLFFLVRRRLTGAQAAGLLAWFALGGLQGLMGWLMVKSGLVDAPHVSPYRLTAHLLLGLALAAGLFWSALRWWRPRPVARHRSWAPRALAALCVSTIFWGGLMAGHRAGIVSDTFPLMHGRWLPEGLWSATLGLANAVANPVAVHFIHRTLGVTTLVFAGVCVVLARRGSRLGFEAALATFAAVMAQVLLGLMTIWLHVPTGFAVAHQLVGFVVTLGALAQVYAAPRRRSARTDASVTSASAAAPPVAMAT